MIQPAALSLPDLYEADETAWLEASAELIAQGRRDELDYPHLSEYLSDMARRDRREVDNRLTVLIEHVLKWRHQPDRRTGSWRRTIIVQRDKLADAVGRGVLWNHAEAVLAEAYSKAVKYAVAETGLPTASFQVECPFTLDQLLSPDLLDQIG